MLRDSFGQAIRRLRLAARFKTQQEMIDQLYEDGYRGWGSSRKKLDILERDVQRPALEEVNQLFEFFLSRQIVAESESERDYFFQLAGWSVNRPKSFREIAEDMGTPGYFGRVFLDWIQRMAGEDSWPDLPVHVGIDLCVRSLLIQVYYSAMVEEKQNIKRESLNDPERWLYLMVAANPDPGVMYFVRRASEILGSVVRIRASVMRHPWDLAPEEHRLVTSYASILLGLLRLEPEHTVFALCHTLVSTYPTADYPSRFEGLHALIYKIILEDPVRFFTIVNVAFADCAEDVLRYARQGRDEAKAILDMYFHKVIEDARLAAARQGQDMPSS